VDVLIVQIRCLSWNHRLLGSDFYYFSASLFIRCAKILVLHKILRPIEANHVLSYIICANWYMVATGVSEGRSGSM